MKLQIFADKLKKSPIALLVATILFLFSTFITISQGFTVVRDYYVSTIGYKKELLKQISGLNAGVHIDNFKNIFGTPLFVNGTLIKEYIFVNNYFYLQAITDSSGTILAYSITIREKNFNPQIDLGPYTSNNISKKIILGETTYLGLADFSDPNEIFSYVGAHNYHYTEGYYFGNPGKYQTFIFSTNESGYNKEDHTDLLPLNSNDATISNSKIKEFRSEETINTYTVTAPLVDKEDLNLRGYIFYNYDNDDGFLLGPSYNQVRVLD